MTSCDTRLAAYAACKRKIDEWVTEKRPPPLAEQIIRTVLAELFENICKDSSDGMARRDTVGRTEGEEETRSGAADAADGTALPTMPVVGTG